MMKHCEQCGSEIPRGNMSYENKKYQKKRFCCRDCHNKSMKKEFPYNCTECGEKVIRTKENIKHNVFCNDRCKGAFIGKRTSATGTVKDKVEIICEYCGKKDKVPQSKKGKKFCNQNCRAKYNAKIITKKQENKILKNCDYCDKEIKRRASSFHTFTFCTKKCLRNFYSESNMFSGKNSGTWNGGMKKYYGENWLSQRRLARGRDEHTCQKCGISEEEYGQELSVHHKKPFVLFDDYKEANELDNLISVCEPCHRKIHSGDNHPSKFKIIG